MKRFFSVFISILIAVFAVYAPIATAQSEDEIRAIFQDSVFFDPNGCSPTTGAAIAGLPSNIDLDAASIAKIQQLLPVYQKYATNLAFRGKSWPLSTIEKPDFLFETLQTARECGNYTHLLRAVNTTFPKQLKYQ